MQVSNKDTRTYVASGVFIFLIILLMLFLTFVPIPTGNKDLIVSIISMLVGGTGVAMGKLFGNTDSELEELKLKYAELRVQHDTLQKEHDRLIALLVERHVINQQGVVP